MSVYQKMFAINLPTADEVLAEENRQRNAILAQMLQQKQQEEPLGKVTFVLQQDGTVNISCEWQNDTKECGEIYGELLYRIGSGNLNNTIGHILSQAAVKTQAFKPFVLEALKQWNKLHTEGNQSPVIHPMAVFKRLENGPEDQHG